jgi:hypothetical protein
MGIYDLGFMISDFGFMIWDWRMRLAIFGLGKCFRFATGQK